MRVSPLALNYNHKGMDRLDLEGAELAAITHGHPLGYMPAAVLTHIINRIVFDEGKSALKDIILEARDTVANLFHGIIHLYELTQIGGHFTSTDVKSQNKIAIMRTITTVITSGFQTENIISVLPCQIWLSSITNTYRGIKLQIVETIVRISTDHSSIKVRILLPRSPIATIPMPANRAMIIICIVFPV
ncbi:hypothetical protein SAMN05216356_101257 [Oribacterium sp. WCC10]|nr:hypothetical protein SAMN05216356_101257 [Oribacterium sp. WCC10]